MVTLYLNHEFFCQKLETIQYNAALAITGAIRGTSTERLYQELGLEYLQSRRWLRRLCLFYKIYKSKSPLYLYNLIPSNRSSITRNSNNIPQLPTRTAFFRNTFFPSVIIEWNKLDFNVRNSVSLEVFKKSILKFIRPSPNSIFKIDSPEGIKLLTRLRVGLSHLRDHKFKYNFQDTLNPLCNCGLEVETTIHFFLHCHNFTILRQTLLNNINDIDNKILRKSDFSVTQTLLFGNQNLSEISNALILNATIEYILATERFSEELFD